MQTVACVLPAPRGLCFPRFYLTLMLLMLCCAWPGKAVAQVAQGANEGEMNQSASPDPAAQVQPAAVPTAAMVMSDSAVTTDTQPAEVLYEAQPGQVVTQSGGALPPGGAETLPTAPPNSPRATVAVKQTDIERILDKIRGATGIQIKAMGAARGVKMDVQFRDMPVEDILNAITVPRKWVWIKRGDGTYEIYDKETYVKTIQSGQRIRYPFQLKYIDAEEFDKIVKTILTPEIGASAPDARTNKLIVTDLPDKIALIESIIKEYDIQLMSRVFQIKHADVEELGERLGELKSKAAEVLVDPVNHVIIVKDTFDKIRQMEQLVELLDREPEMRVYNLNNIGLDSDIANDLVETFIEPIVTKDALVKYNEATGKLFVRDVATVQEKIQEVLDKLDSPRKQVMIEGEILSVAQNFEKTLGMDWSIGRNLKDAINGGVQVPGVGTETGSSSGGDTTSTNSLTLSAFDSLKKGLPYATIGSGGLSVFELTDHVRAQLNAALTDERTRVLLRPRLILANQEEGSFENTQDEPVLNTYYNGYDNNSNNNDSSSSGGYSPYRSSSQTMVTSGLIVEIQAQISNRGLVEMQVMLENSSPIIRANIGNNQRGVGKRRETVETVLIVPSGETRVIGGLISDDNSEADSGIPYLVKIPYLKYLFGSNTKKNSKRNLMFFITPTIMDEKPVNDLIVEPVNEAARIAMEEAAQVAPAKDVNKIPEELLPYLEEIRPEAKPMPGVVPLPEAGGSDAPAVEAMPLPEVSDETPLAPNDEAAAAAGQTLLSDEPYMASSHGNGSDLVAVGGAIDQPSNSVAGPSGTFGGTERAVFKPAPKPTAKPANPADAGAEPAASTEPAAGGGDAAAAKKAKASATATPTPTPTPTSTPRPQTTSKSPSAAAGTPPPQGQRGDDNAQPLMPQPGQTPPPGVTPPPQ